MKAAKSISIPGAVISMGGRDWVIPPLTLGQLRRLMPKVRTLTTVGAGMGEEEIGILVEVVAAAMSRNYADVTITAVEDLLDMGNANAVLMTVLTGSGLKRGEEAAAMSTGQTSTAFAPPPQATPSQK